MTMAEPKRKRRHDVSIRVRSRIEMLVTGELKVEDLDDEELRRMQLKNSQGDFRGRPPAWIPREIAMHAQEEFRKRVQSELQDLVPDALRATKEILNSRHLQPGDGARLRAAEMIYERTLGKVTQTTESHVVVDKGKSWDDFIEDAIIDVEAEDAEEIEG